MNKKTIIIISAVILVALAIFFAYRFGKNSNNPPAENSPTNNTNTEPTQQTPTTQTPANADNHNVFDDCTALKTSQAVGKQYQNGTLLVTFNKEISFAQAKNIIDTQKLSADTSIESENNFNTYHWLTINVPKGDEFKWQCNLEMLDAVKRAGLNPIINLHE